MKNFFMPFIAIILAINFSAAQQLRPVELVDLQKSESSNFEEIDVLTTALSKKTKHNLPKELVDYSLFTLNKDKMNALQSAAPETISFALPGKKSKDGLILELVKVEITADDFEVTEMPSGNKVTLSNSSSHYRGIIKGMPNSIAAINFTDGEISGFASIPGEAGNKIIGKLRNSDEHIVYNDSDLAGLDDFRCSADLSEMPEYTKEQLELSQKAAVAATKCVTVYYDVDHTILEYLKTTAKATSHVQSLFNQVATIFANENISLKLSGITIWTSKAPFSNGSYSDVIEYINYRDKNRVRATLKQMLSVFFGSGGAAFTTTCPTSSRSTGYSYAGIGHTIKRTELYSNAIGSMAHELGHNLGSKHTHECVWNGNNTAIDGCRKPKGCADPGRPSDGGTIMSYCKPRNLSNGFGLQPGNVIRNRVANSDCLETCCKKGDKIRVTFRNFTDCKIELFWNNKGTLKSYGQISANKGTKSQNTFIGHKWVIGEIGSSVNLKTFTIACGRKTYTTTGSCGICNGLKEWPAGSPFSSGDRVTYKGNGYEWLGSSWKHLGSCDSKVAQENIPGFSTSTPQLKVYPNPAQDFITVDLQGFESEDMYLIDVTGKIVDKIKLQMAPDGSSIQKINSSNFASGLYFIRVVTGGKSLVKKVFVK